MTSTEPTAVLAVQPLQLHQGHPLVAVTQQRLAPLPPADRKAQLALQLLQPLLQLRARPFAGLTCPLFLREHQGRKEREKRSRWLGELCSELLYLFVLLLHPLALLLLLLFQAGSEPGHFSPKPGSCCALSIRHVHPAVLLGCSQLPLPAFAAVCCFGVFWCFGLLVLVSGLAVEVGVGDAEDAAGAELVVEECGGDDVVLGLYFPEGAAVEPEFAPELVDEAVVMADDVEQHYLLFVHVLQRVLVLLLRPLVARLQALYAALVLGHQMHLLLRLAAVELRSGLRVQLRQLQCVAHRAGLRVIAAREDEGAVERVEGLALGSASLLHDMEQQFFDKQTISYRKKLRVCWQRGCSAAEKVVNINDSNQSLLERMLLLCFSMQDWPSPLLPFPPTSRASVASTRLLISSFTCLLTWYRHSSCALTDYCSLSACTPCIEASILASCSVILAISCFTSFFMISTISALGTLYFEPNCSFLRAAVLSLPALASEQRSYGYLACFFSTVDSLLSRPPLPLLSECLPVLSTMQMQSRSFSLLAFLPSTLLWLRLLSLPSLSGLLAGKAGGLQTSSGCAAL